MRFYFAIRSAKEIMFVQNTKIRGILLILLAACGYATVALFGKWIFIHQLPIYTVLSWRFGGAALLFLFWTWRSRTGRATLKKAFPCILIGLLGDASQTSFFFFSIARVGASLAAVLLYTFPLFVLLIQRFFFQHKINKMQWMSLAVSFCGGLLVIDPFQQISLVSDYGVGIFFGLATAAIYACYLSFSAHFTKELPAAAASSYLSIGAFISFAGLAFSRREFAMPSGDQEWLLAGSIILFATVIPLLCLIKGMQYIGPAHASLIFTVEPLVTILFSSLFFNESLTLLQILGSVLILSAVVFKQMEKPTSSVEERV